MLLNGRLSTGLILGIESSCDETAAAVVRGGRDILANVVASQMTLHARYGGVVPELASREHLRNIVPVVREAMGQAGIRFADLDAVAVTEGPGLAGALLVGITYAKALALALGKPLLGVNHLEGHIQAVLMEPNPGEATAEPAANPLIALVVSGGHTHLYAADFYAPAQPATAQPAAIWHYRNVGRTVDDAAGEAFDKVAKLLGLGYPGGPWIDTLAQHGDPAAVPFRFGEIKRRTPAGREATDPSQSFDFSFSGIKTAVLRYIQTHAMADKIAARRAALTAMLNVRPNLQPADVLSASPELFDPQTLDLIASFQSAVVQNLIRQTFRAADAHHARAIIVSGGVSANSELRRRFSTEAARRGVRIDFPAIAMATDNAAMIAAAGWVKFLARDWTTGEMVANPQLRLG